MFCVGSKLEMVDENNDNNVFIFDFLVDVVGELMEFIVFDVDDCIVLLIEEEDVVDVVVDVVVDEFVVGYVVVDDVVVVVDDVIVVVVDVVDVVVDDSVVVNEMVFEVDVVDVVEVVVVEGEFEVVDGFDVDIEVVVEVIVELIVVVGMLFVENVVSDEVFVE